MSTKSNGSRALKVLYNCDKCPSYCCSYVLIGVYAADIRRLARHFNITPEEAKKRYTKIASGERVLRHRKDDIYGSVCQFLDQETRRCGIYDARPGVCREYPDTSRCGYYDFLSWERRHQDDPEFIPLRGGVSL